MKLNVLASLAAWACFVGCAEGKEEAAAKKEKPKEPASYLTVESAPADYAIQGEYASEGDEAMGVRALAQALAAPMRAIVENAGLDASPLLHEARRHGPGCVFDVLRREWVNAWDAGIVDPLPVALAALQTIVSTATMALTTEVLVRHKKPEMAKNP